MSLSKIPLPEVLENLSFESILAERKTRLITLAEEQYQASGDEKKLERLEDTLKLESEPMVKLLQESAYRELLLRQRVNDAARAVMLPLAQGTDLDNLGALYGVQRSELADDLNEGDEPYRQRLLLAPKSLSTAGSAAAYKFHALSAGNMAEQITVQSASDAELLVSYRYATHKNQVKDATIESPQPCVVNINVLGFDGYGQLNSDSIGQISEFLKGDKIRPVGDRVTVFAASIVLYQLKLTLHFIPELQGSPQIEALLQQVRRQLVSFVKQHHYLGKAIRHSTLLGVVSPLIEGWVELTIAQQGQSPEPAEPILAEQDLLMTSQQAPYLDLSQTTDDLSWDDKLAQAIDQSITVKFDG